MSSEPPPHPPMKEDEYRDIVRSHLLHWVFIFFFAAVALFLSTQGYIPYGIDTTILLAICFGLIAGMKFFPESGKVFTRRFRNYRRVLKGKSPLDEDDVPESKYHSDFREG